MTLSEKRRQYPGLFDEYARAYDRWAEHIYLRPITARAVVQVTLACRVMRALERQLGTHVREMLPPGGPWRPYGERPR